MHFAFTCQHISSSVSHAAARSRGVLCVSGERGPLASERHALCGKGEVAEGGLSCAGGRTPRGDLPPKGNPEESPGAAKRDRGRRRGRSGQAEESLWRAVREGAEKGRPGEWGRGKA